MQQLPQLHIRNSEIRLPKHPRAPPTSTKKVNPFCIVKRAEYCIKRSHERGNAVIGKWSWGVTHEEVNTAIGKGDGGGRRLWQGKHGLMERALERSSVWGSRETGLSRFLVIYLGILVFCSTCLFMQWWIESSATELWIAFFIVLFFVLLFLHHLKRDSRHGFQSSIFLS